MNETTNEALLDLPPKEPALPVSEPTDAPPEDTEPLLADSEQNSDSDLPSEEQPSSADELACLRDELNMLRHELDAERSARERIEAQYEEFHALYPDTSVTDLPDAVWRDVERGTPLAAAFALEERRKLLTAQKAELSNAENKERSAGAMSGAEKEFFTRDEVRRMSQRDVRANLQKIMLSMKKWH